MTQISASAPPLLTRTRASMDLANTRAAAALRGALCLPLQVGPLSSITKDIET